MKMTEAIGKFLQVKANDNNRDLVDRWSPAMETQLIVDESKGTQVAEGKRVWIFEDEHDSYEFKNIRIPFDAKSNPIDNDGEIDFPLGDVAEGIGSTGWDYKRRVSRWVGFDFDSIINHGGTGLTEGQLDEIEGLVRSLPYVEVRKSTSGTGIHLYVMLDEIPTSNHTEHAALANLVLAKMGTDCNFNLMHHNNGQQLVDARGGNMWIWHRKMTRENEGLKLLKEATQTLTVDDLPKDWQEQIKGESPVKRSSDSAKASKYVIQAAQRYIAKCESVGRGGRNKAAMSIAGHLASFEGRVTHSRLHENDIPVLMMPWNMQNSPPLDGDELAVAVAGGVHRGTPRETKWVDEDEAVNVDELIAEAAADGAPPSQTPQNRQKKKQIEIKINHELDRMVRQAAKALGDAENTYVYGQALVEVVYDAEKPKQCLFDNGSPQLVPIPKPTLATRLSVCAQWNKYHVKDKVWIPALPNDKVVNAVHVLNKWPSIPTITGIVSSPVLRADGSILVEHGYDPETGLFLESDESFPSLMSPQSAVNMLHDVVADFPFEKAGHRSAWVAFLITLLVRPAFAGSAPFFLFDANCSGVGKGLLTDVATMIVEGRKACRYSWSKDNEETRKLITTVGVSGVSYLLWDNVVGKLGGAALEQMMTTGVWADRILSLNRQVTFPIRFIAAGTSNNAKLTSDMTRRTCHCKLLTAEENPSERTGFRHPNLLTYVKSKRRELVMAALSIPSGYLKAGRPDQDLPAWGSYEEWSELVRGAIVWAGLPDPGETREGLRDQTDDDTATLRAIVAAWPSEAVTVAQAIQMAEPDTELGEAMSELPVRNRPQELGNMLRGARGRVIAGKRLHGTSTKPVKWHVEDASSAAAVSSS